MISGMSFRRGRRVTCWSLAALVLASATSASAATSMTLPILPTPASSPCTAEPFIISGTAHVVFDDEKTYTTVHATAVGSISGLRYTTQGTEHRHETDGTIYIYDRLIRASESTVAVPNPTPAPVPTGVGDDFYLRGQTDLFGGFLSPPRIECK
jgi:hypothetical protein